MYKMIAVDMDGTLLRNDKTISEETIRAIRLARQKNVKIVLATGRPLEGVRIYLENLDLLKEDDYVITFNGSLIQNTKTNEIIFRKALDFQDFKYLSNLSTTLEIDVHAFTDEGLISPRMSKYTELESSINNISVKITDFNSITQIKELIKFMMVGDKDRLDKAYSKLSEKTLQKYTVVRSAPYFLEFLNKECNKGEAVRNLASHLNIDIKDVICIGDAGNDYHMIKYAGLGVAMANAFPEVKKIADFITKTNDEDGVAHVIHRFILAS